MAIVNSNSQALELQNHYQYCQATPRYFNANTYILPVSAVISRSRTHAYKFSLPVPLTQSTKKNLNLALIPQNLATPKIKGGKYFISTANHRLLDSSKVYDVVSKKMAAYVEVIVHQPISDVMHKLIVPDVKRMCYAF